MFCKKHSSVPPVICEITLHYITTCITSFFFFFILFWNFVMSCCTTAVIHIFFLIHCSNGFIIDGNRWKAFNFSCFSADNLFSYICVHHVHFAKSLWMVCEVKFSICCQKLDYKWHTNCFLVRKTCLFSGRCLKPLLKWDYIK